MYIKCIYSEREEGTNGMEDKFYDVPNGSVLIGASLWACVCVCQLQEAANFSASSK